MSAHTPGPWATQDHVSKVSNFGGWQGRIHAGPLGIGKVFGGDKNEVLANARLVAAAPDMLKALDRLLCAWNDGVDEDTDALFDAFHEARRVYKAAHGDKTETALPSQGNPS